MHIGTPIALHLGMDKPRPRIRPFRQCLGTRGRLICTALLSVGVGLQSDAAHARVEQPRAARVIQAPMATAHATPIARKALTFNAAIPGELGDDIDDDPLLSDQWALTDPATNPGGAQLLDAWQSDLAQSRVTVAVVDSGVVLTHPDLGNLLPGYDFISDPLTGNDGDGRDNDPSDTGDWVSASDIDSGVVDDDCQVQSSTWHGTAVTGILAATRDNNRGIAGAATDIDVLPVRVMGKCGGTVADLTDGIRWAAGLDVPGAPDNPNPAQVINLSLGITSACTTAFQQTIDDVTRAGAVVVVAAGNQAANMDIEPHSPATCDNVITVGAARRDGALSSYSSYGSAVDLLAPGGEPNDGVITTEDSGTRAPAHTEDYGRRYGTSMATPHVSATVAMMIAVNPLLSVDDIAQHLADSSTPTTSACSGCGAGLLNAENAVLAAAGAPTTGALSADTALKSGGPVSPLLLIGLWLLARFAGRESVSRIRH